MVGWWRIVDFFVQNIVEKDFERMRKVREMLVTMGQVERGRCVVLPYVVP